MPGGNPVGSGEFPHVAAVGHEANGSVEWFCSAFMISYRFCLTAAHCKYYKNNEEIANVVRLTNENLYHHEDAFLPREYKIAEFIKHPDYNPRFQYHDIALIKLGLGKTPIFTSFAATSVLAPNYEVPERFQTSYEATPACMQTKKAIGTDSFVSMGWGATSRGGEGSKELLKVNLTLASNEECNVYFRNQPGLPQGIISSQICAWDPIGRQDTW